MKIKLEIEVSDPVISSPRLHRLNDAQINAVTKSLMHGLEERIRGKLRDTHTFTRGDNLAFQASFYFSDENIAALHKLL